MCGKAELSFDVQLLTSWHLPAFIPPSLLISALPSSHNLPSSFLGCCVNHEKHASELLPTPRVTAGSVLCPFGVCVFHSILSRPVPQ